MQNRRSTMKRIVIIGALLFVAWGVFRSPTTRLIFAGAHRTHLKSGEWVIAGPTPSLTDSRFVRLASAINDSGDIDVLRIEGASLTDNGFAPIRTLDSLYWVDLVECNFSDAALTHLYGLGNLRLVEIENCPNISDAGVQALRAALPDCEVRHKNGT